MNFSLKNKTAFITGGSAGIGLAVAKRFVADGARVVISDISDGTAVAEKIGAEFVRVNVADETDVAKGLEAAEKLLGKLDIVVNNAGVGDIGPTIEETEQTVLKKITEINQYGVFYGLKHAPKHMNDGGSIINTSSMAGVYQMSGTSVYAATKAAVISMSRTSALELASRGIRVNAILPGYFKTDMGDAPDARTLCAQLVPLGRMGSLDELVGAYHFFAAEESSYVTGQALELDGGLRSGPSTQLFETLLGKANVG